MRDFQALFREMKLSASYLTCSEKIRQKKKIVDTLLEQYDASREEVEKDVAGVITRLKKIGAIDE